jgi:ADP-heptose:LPS heptosyltransferase
MKILVLELARLGDIFQTWPALRALKRKHPEAEVHVLTRERYQAALDGLDVVDQVHLLETKNIFEPLFQQKPDVEASYKRISQKIDDLKEMQFDWIINFSFSPVSSYLAHALTQPNTRVTGYTRHKDGFLAIPDDMSAYFYAQVGLERKNRFHLCDIFASMLEMDLTPEDWCGPNFLTAKTFQEDQIVVHVGASEVHKRLTGDQWAQILEIYLQKAPQDKVVLIGTAEESGQAQAIEEKLPKGSIINQVGKTKLRETFSIIHNSRLVVGADSAPMHMASLTQTPCVNLSIGKVNFWETGPRAAGSVILKAANITRLGFVDVAEAIFKVRNQLRPDLRWIQTRPGQAPSYSVLEPKGADFDWKFIQAIYVGQDFPETDKHEFFEGMKNLFEINRLILEQLEKIQQGKDLQAVASIIQRGEEIIQTVGQLVPSLSILVRWYQTEKVRLGPAPHEVTLQRTIEIHELFLKVCSLYVDLDAMNSNHLAELSIENSTANPKDEV